MYIEVLMMATALVRWAELGLVRLVWVPLKVIWIVHMILIIFFISHLLKHLNLFGVII